MSPWWEVFWFFLPAGIANMSPVLAARLPLLRNWSTPIDFGLSYKGVRILGPNKTWRGLVFGTMVAIVVGLLQYRVVASSSESIGFIMLVSGALGFGALLGDAVESFFKRQRGVNSGESWFPFDQIDYIVGGIILVLPFISLSLVVMAQTLALYFGLHLLFSYFGYLLGVKKRPF